MDLTTVVGTVLAFGLILFAIASGQGGMTIFVDVPSVMIVGGGTLAVTLMSFPGHHLRSLVKVLLRSYLARLSSPAEEIERIVGFATLARKEGLLALEGKLDEIDDPFFSKGIQLVIDGVAAETVRDIMSIEAEWQRARHVSGKKMLDVMGAMAPAFGMIGTLVGLVQMLQSLSDPSKIGGGMATALLTTLYGAMAANMVFIPLSSKLEMRANEEALLRELMVEGIVSIQAGEGAQLIKEKLSAFLSPQAREAMAA